MRCIVIASTFIGVVVGIATLGTCVWLGVSMLVPESPFDTRNIAGGVCLIVFSVFSAIAAGMLAWFSTGGVCIVARNCDDDCCCC